MKRRTLAWLVVGAIAMGVVLSVSLALRGLMEQARELQYESFRRSLVAGATARIADGEWPRLTGRETAWQDVPEAEIERLVNSLRATRTLDENEHDRRRWQERTNRGLQMRYRWDPEAGTYEVHLHVQNVGRVGFEYEDRVRLPVAKGNTR